MREKITLHRHWLSRQNTRMSHLDCCPVVQFMDCKEHGRVDDEDHHRRDPDQRVVHDDDVHVCGVSGVVGCCG